MFRIQQSTLLLRDLQSMHEDFSLNLWCFVFPAEGGENAALGTVLLIVPIQKSTPEVGLLVSFYHLLQGKILVCDLGRVYDIEGGQSFVDWQCLDPVRVAFGLHLERAQYIFSLAKVLAMLDAHHNSVDDLPIALAFGQVLPPHLGPVDLCAVEDLEAVGIIYLNPLRDVGTLNDGRIISMPGLDQIDTLIEVVILLHDLPYIFILTQRKSQINLSWVKLKYVGADLEKSGRGGKRRGMLRGWEMEGSKGNGFEGKMRVLGFQLRERV